MLRELLAAPLNALAFWLSDKKLIGFNFNRVRADIESFSGVKGVCNVHVWRENKRTTALAAQIAIDDLTHRDTIKRSLKAMLENRYGITLAILEAKGADCVN